MRGPQPRGVFPLSTTSVPCCRVEDENAPASTYHSGVCSSQHRLYVGISTSSTSGAESPNPRRRLHKPGRCCGHKQVISTALVRCCALLCSLCCAERLPPPPACQGSFSHHPVIPPPSCLRVPCTGTSTSLRPSGPGRWAALVYRRECWVGSPSQGRET